LKKHLDSVKHFIVSQLVGLQAFFILLKMIILDANFRKLKKINLFSFKSIKQQQNELLLTQIKA